MFYGNELALSGTMLVPEPSIPLSPTLALALGDIPSALVVQQLHFWVATHMIGEFCDGRRWVKQSFEDWLALMPYTSDKTLRRTVKALRDKGIILARHGLGGADPFDRSLWYTVNYEALQAVVRPVLQKRIAEQNGLAAVAADTVKMTTSENTDSRDDLGEKSGLDAVFSDTVKMTECSRSNWLDAGGQNDRMFYVVNSNNKYISGLEKNPDDNDAEQGIPTTAPLVKSSKKNTPAPNPRHEALLEIWNDERGPLARAKRVTAKYAAGFNRFIQDYGDDAETNFRLAVQLIVNRGYYLRDGVPQYGLENLLAADNYIKHVENALAAKKATNSPKTETTIRPAADTRGFELKSTDFVPPDIQRLAESSLAKLKEYLDMGLDGTNAFVCRAVDGVVLWEVTVLMAIADESIPNSLLRVAIERYPQYQLDSKLFW